MIRYGLACDKGHEFESWFPSAASYDDQAARGFVACPVCGSTKVGKTIMAPQVARRDRGEARAVATLPAEPSEAPANAPAMPPSAPLVAGPVLGPEEREFRAKLKALRDHMLASADNVGPRFAEEARQMHEGEIDHRPITGTATAEEAKAMVEDGIEFYPVPVLPDERN